MSDFSRVGWAALVLLGLIVGCGDAADTAAVSGQVTVAGKPLPEGAISFFPADGSRPVATTVDAEGAYKVSLPAGDYTVVVQASTKLPEGWQEGDPLPPQPVRVPPAYGQPTTSPLSLTVEAGASLERDFAVK